MLVLAERFRMHRQDGTVPFRDMERIGQLGTPGRLEAELAMEA